jgi:hypothetical protein
VIELNLTAEEAHLVLNALQGSERNMRTDSRHDRDRRRLESLIIRLEAEIEIERRGR